MQRSPPPSRRLRDYTKIPFEILISGLTVIPFFLLAYFYSALPEQVPLFLSLDGDVEVWGKKSLLSVFRVPLMAVVTQVICLLMKYGAIQSKGRDANIGRTEIAEQYLRLQVGLWDWFRGAVAFKMCAASLDTIFLSIERFKFLSRPAFILSAVAALLGAAGAVYLGYRMLVMSREIRERLKDRKVEQQVDARYLYGGVLYFNPSDSSLFVGKHVFNFANKWAWVFIASVIAYPLLVFLPS